MTLIKSISGIRGTIGGKSGDALTPLDIVKFAAAYGAWLKTKTSENLRVVIGRDARISGKMVSDLVNATLIGMGFDVIDLAPLRRRGLRRRTRPHSGPAPTAPVPA